MEVHGRGPSRTAVVRLLEEAKTVLANQLTMARDLDDKAAQVLRFNAVVVGLLVAAASVLAEPLSTAALPAGTRLLFPVGILLLVASTLLAVIAYRTGRVAAGLNGQDLLAFLDFDATEDELLGEAIRTYARGIIRNSKFIERTARWLEAGLLTLPLGLLSVTAAAIPLLVQGAHFL